jgi:ankyrin repeat protein
MLNITQEYYGEIVLHIAIINRNATMVEWLLGDKYNRPYREQQLAAVASGHQYAPFVFSGRPCYYGGTPLAFACCTNQWNIAEILLKYGASIDMVSRDRYFPEANISSKLLLNSLF